MNYIKSLLSAGTKDSIMRVLSAFVVLDIMLMWNYMCIQKNEFLAIPWDTAVVITAVLAAKALQKKFEVDKMD